MRSELDQVSIFRAPQGASVGDLLRHIGAAAPSAVLLHGSSRARAGEAWEGDVDLLFDVGSKETLGPLVAACERSGYRHTLLVQRAESDPEVVLLFGRGDPWSLRLVRGLETVLLDLDFGFGSSAKSRHGGDMFARHPQLDVRILKPEARAAYLCVKRIRKGAVSRDAWSRIAADQADEAGIAEHLARIFEVPLAQRLAACIREGTGPDDELLLAARTMMATRRRAVGDRVRRGVRVVEVAGGRLRRPPGMLVCIEGPDGSGKSSLAAGLETAGLARSVVRAHWRPGLLPPLARLAGRSGAHALATPHARPAKGPLGSLFRLLYYWIDFIVGYWTKVWPQLLRGNLFVLERGWLDMMVDQRRYQLRVHPRVFEILGWLVPKADVHLILRAPPEIVLSRKQEIGSSEISRQLAAWRTVGSRLHGAGFIDATVSPSETLGAAVEAIAATQVRRLPARAGAAVTP